MDRIDPKVDEAIQTLNMKDGPTRRRLLQGTGLVSATAAASALLAACSSSGSGSTSEAANTAGNFPKTPAWQFWFVNHVTTNPFFVPTQYGFEDAAALLERSGVYAPLLALAEACEAGDDRAFAELADRLLLSGHQINMAHLQALAWAEELLAT